MSKTPFEHFCSVLDGTDEADCFKTLNNIWKINSKKGNFYYINCMDLYNIKFYEHFCNACNHVNKDKYNTFIINILKNTGF